MSNRTLVFAGWAISALLSPVAHADATKALKSCYARAQTCAEGFTKSDDGTLVACTLPAVVKMVGGPEALIATVKKGKEQMRAQGYEFLSATVDPPKELIRGGDTTFAVVPESVLLKVPNGKLRSISYMLGVSTNGGDSWWFLDGSGITPEKLKTLLPSFPASAKLPAKQEPEFTADK